jgi:hypothetical protein
MEIDDIHGGLAVQGDGKTNLSEEIEKADDLDHAKAGGDPFTAKDERRLVRKLDLWYDMIHNQMNVRPSELTLSPG